MYKSLILLILGLLLNANELILEKGYIKAHTEVFGDSEINPIATEISSKLFENGSIENIKGKILIQSSALKSENKNRDENMYKTLNSEVFPKISYDLKGIKKVGDEFKTIGTLILNGKKNEVSSIVEIKSIKKNLILKGHFSIKLTDFGIEPPSMFFVTVRDKIDIKYDLNYIRRNK